MGQGGDDRLADPVVRRVPEADRGLFLSHERLDPETLSRPDSRPTVREEVAILGDLLKEFDFGQDPLPPVILDPVAGRLSGSTFPDGSPVHPRGPR